MTLLFLLAQSTFYVEELHASESGDGSESKPFRTIAQAMQRAKDGDSIVIRDGLYAESIEFKAGIAVRGDAKRGRPVVRGRVRMADRTRLEDVDVSPDVTPGAVYGYGIEDVVLRGVRVRGIREREHGHDAIAGMDFFDCRRLLIRECAVEDLEERAWGSLCGIRLVACDAKLLSNRIRSLRETEWGGAYGLFLIESRVEVVGNRISHVSETDWAGAYGILLLGCRGSEIRNNTIVGISEDGWSQGYGIFADLDTEAVIRNNVVCEMDVDDGAGIRNGSDRTQVGHNLVWVAVKGVRSFEGRGGDHLIEKDPQLREDLTFAENSPCCDGGDPELKDVDGSRSDLGAGGGPAPTDQFAVERDEALEGRVRKLIERFASDSVDEREAAHAELARMIPDADRAVILQELRRGAESKDEEVQSRCRDLLAVAAQPSAIARWLYDDPEDRIDLKELVAKASRRELLLLFYPLNDTHSDDSVTEILVLQDRISELILAFKRDGDDGDRFLRAIDGWALGKNRPKTRQVIRQASAGRIRSPEDRDDVIRSLRDSLKD